MSIQISSSAFANGQQIPRKYRAKGRTSRRHWLGRICRRAQELVLICDNPDAPTHDPWVHWLIYKIPTSLAGLPEGVPQQPRLKTRRGRCRGRTRGPRGDNIGYRGPMPPPGHGTHHYHFTLYALEAKLVAEPGMDKNTLLRETGRPRAGPGRVGWHLPTLRMKDKG